MDLWAHLDYNRHSVKNVLIFGITFYELQIFSRKRTKRKTHTICLMKIHFGFHIHCAFASISLCWIYCYIIQTMEIFWCGIDSNAFSRLAPNWFRAMEWEGSLKPQALFRSVFRGVYGVPCGWVVINKFFIRNRTHL